MGFEIPVQDDFEDTSIDTSIQDDDINILNNETAPLINADQIAAQNAFTESIAQGTSFDEVFKTHSLSINEYGLEKSSEVIIDSVSESLRKAQKENVQQAAFSSDVDRVQTLVQTKDITPTPEELFVSTVAKEDASIDRIVKYSEQLRGNNLIQDMLSKAESDKTWFVDTFAYILNNAFLPGHSAAVDNEVIGDILDKKLGFIDKRTASADMFRDLKAYYNVLEPEDRGVFMNHLYDSVTEASGTVFDNPEEVASFFRKFQKYTDTDAGLNNVFTGLDIALYPVGIFTGIVKMAAKSGNAAVSKAVANTEVAANSIAKDIIEGTNTSGIPSFDLMSEALKSGKNPYTINGELLSGAEDSIQKALAEQAASQETKILIDMAGPTGLGPSEIESAASKYRTLYTEASSSEYKRFDYKGADDLGVNFEITYTDPNFNGFLSKEQAQAFAKRNNIAGRLEETDEGTFLLKSDYSHKFTINDVAPLDLGFNSAVQKMPQFVQFPLQSIDPAAVYSRVVGVHQEDTARVAFEKLHKTAEKGLTAKNNAKVESMLQKGNDAGKVFTPDELQVYGLSPKEQSSYYQKRTLRDISYLAHNKALTDRLTFLGNKEINYTGEFLDETRIAGKVLSPEEATGFVVQPKMVIQVTEDGLESIEVTTQIAKELYEQGYRMVRSASTHNTSKGSTNTFMMKSADLEVSELQQVLPYRVGEQSRIYSDPYFVTMNFKGLKDGESSQVIKTIRSAGTSKSAEKFASDFNNAMRIVRYAASKEGIGFTGKEVAKALSKYVDNPTDFLKQVKNNEIPLDAEFSTKFDREMVLGSKEHTDSVVDTLFSQGRLFTSKRNEQLLNVLGEPAAIKSPREALAKEMSYVSRFINSATWRESMLDKIVKTFEGKLKPIEGGTKWEHAFKGEPVGMNPRELNYLETLRHHVKTQLGVPSESTIKHQARMREWARMAENIPRVGDWASKTMLDFSHKSVSQALRTAVFHSYLGLANVAQMFVQANGAFIAAAISPQHGLQAAKNSGAIRLGLIYDSVGNDKALKALAHTASTLEAGLTSADEFLDAVKLARETGILNGMKSSALHYVQEGAVNLETNLAAYTGGVKSALRKTGSNVLKAGLFPFNRGEEFARLMSLDIARREFIKANPGVSVLSRAAKNEIIARQETLTLGMSRANRGKMQEGLLSIPFQFAHYSWKLMESLAGKQFTNAEKARIIVAGSLLYGAEGMGLKWLVDEMLPAETIENMDEMTKRGIAQGGLSYLIEATTGAKTAVGDRIGPVKYFTENITDIASGDLSLMASISGASGSFLTKEYNTVHEFIRVYNTEDVDLGDKAQMYLHQALRAASSGYSNISKYAQAIWGDGYIRSGSGQRIGKISSLEATLAVMGLGDYKAFAAFNAQDILRNTGKIKSDFVKGRSKLMSMYYSANTQSERDLIYKQIASYDKSIPEAFLAEVIDGAHKAVTVLPKFQENLDRIRIQTLQGKVEPSISIPRTGE